MALGGNSYALSVERSLTTSEEDLHDHWQEYAARVCGSEDFKFILKKIKSQRRIGLPQNDQGDKHSLILEGLVQC